MNSYLKYFVCFSAIDVMMAGMGCVNKSAPTAIPHVVLQANESALPSMAEVQQVARNASVITPVYVDPFIHTTVAWTVSFRQDNLFGQGQVKTIGELNGLAGKIQAAGETVSTLKNQGCEQISVAPFSGAVSAKIGSATITGNFTTNQYNIYGTEQFVSAPKGWSVWSIEYVDYKRIGQFVIEDDHGVRGNCPDCIVGDWYRLRYTTPINGVSKKNVDALKLQLKQLNVTLTF